MAELPLRSSGDSPQLLRALVSKAAETVGRALSEFWCVPGKQQRQAYLPHPDLLSSAQQTSSPRGGPNRYTAAKVSNQVHPQMDRVRKCDNPTSFSDTHLNPSVFVLSHARQVRRVVTTSTAQIISQCPNASHSTSVAIQYWFYLEQKELFDDKI